MDDGERQRIREQYASAPGVGHHVERAMAERDNALAYGQHGTAERAAAELEALGYDPPDKRARAAAARKDAAGDKDAGKDSEPAGPRRQPPAGRKTPQAAQHTAQQPKPPQKT